LNNGETSYSDWDDVSTGVPQQLILGPFLFLVYITDLPTIFNNDSLPFLFSSDRSVFVASLNHNKLCMDVKETYFQLHTWFKCNLLSLNVDKRHFIHFKTRNTTSMFINTGEHPNTIMNIHNIKFLNITIENSLNWGSHVDQLLSRLSTAFNAIRAIKPFMSYEAIISVYFAYFHSILSYGIIFWGNSPNSIDIFWLKKKVIRIISGIKSSDSCNEYFKKLRILPLLSQYIFSILMFVAENANYYTFYSVMRNVNMRHTFDHYQPSSSLTIFNMGVFSMRIKVFNNFPLDIKVFVHNTKCFKRQLKTLLYSNYFYTLQEYFNYQC
jgi:hypothetical protein